jgi:hypothetical protein
MRHEDFRPAARVVQIDALAELANKINAEHNQSELAGRKCLEHCRKAGEALLEAKKKVGHGGWLPWLKANVKFSYRQASRYMRVAENWSKLDTASNLRDALRLLTEEPEPVEPEADVTSGLDDETKSATVADLGEEVAHPALLHGERYVMYGNTPGHAAQVELDEDPRYPGHWFWILKVWNGEEDGNARYNPKSLWREWFLRDRDVYGVLFKGWKFVPWSEWITEPALTEPPVQIEWVEQAWYSGGLDKDPNFCMWVFSREREKAKGRHWDPWEDSALRKTPEPKGDVEEKEPEPIDPWAGMTPL